MLRLLDDYAHLFQSWRIQRYEQEGEAYMLHISAVLTDNSRLEVRDYLFTGGKRKYAYQWLEPDGTLRQRWDNAPHWLNIATFPHHTHLPGENIPQASIITNLEDLLDGIEKWLAEQNME